jgi:hypothetical protein
MCGPTTTFIPSKPTPRWFDGIFPLHPSIAAVVMAYFLPSLLNRGFTVWFHWASALYALTQSRLLVDVLALTGVSICIGWYACLAYEFFYYGRFFHSLYRNMPFVQELIHTEDGALDFESAGSLAAMAICHFLDFLGHPVLAYYFWKKCRRQNKERDSDGITFYWPAIFLSYTFSRIWSFVHTYYNYGSVAWFYVGFDVYVIDSLDLWYPAYVTESLLYGAVVVWKLTRKSTQPFEPKKGQIQ